MRYRPPSRAARPSSSRASAPSARARRRSSPRRSRASPRRRRSTAASMTRSTSARRRGRLRPVQARGAGREAARASPTAKPPIVSLAATMALEHFTAILAHQLLADPRHLEGAEREAADLWRWHACEEIEHKGVAYDTWLHATRDWPRWKRWKVKAQGDALRHPQLRRRPDRRRARADAAGRRDRACAPGRGCSGTCGCVPGMFRKIARSLVQVLPAGLPSVERGRSGAARGV